MKVSKFLTAAAAAASMLGASSAIAAPAQSAAAKLSVASAQSLRIGGIDKKSANRNLNMLLANPIVIAGVIATAIAVPLAVSNSHPASP